MRDTVLANSSEYYNIWNEVPVSGNSSQTDVIEHISLGFKFYKRKL